MIQLKCCALAQPQIKLPEKQNPAEQWLYLYPVREIQVRAKVSHLVCVAQYATPQSVSSTFFNHFVFFFWIFWKSPQQHFKMLYKLREKCATAALKFSLKRETGRQVMQRGKPLVSLKLQSPSAWRVQSQCCLPSLQLCPSFISCRPALPLRLLPCTYANHCVFNCLLWECCPTKILKK